MYFLPFCAALYVFKTVLYKKTLFHYCTESHSRDKCYKTFQQPRVFVLGKPFQPSLMFVGKARSLSKSGEPERSFTQLGPSPANIRQGRIGLLGNIRKLQLFF